MKKVLISIIIILSILLSCTLTTLYTVGYYSNNCINLDNVCNYYIDNNDNLVLVVKNVHKTDNDVFTTYDSYIIEK